MNNENDRLDGVDNLESLIDRALESYTPCAPRPGLEQRVLASLDAENHPRPRFWSWRLTWVDRLQAATNHGTPPRSSQPGRALSPAHTRRCLVHKENAADSHSNPARAPAAVWPAARDQRGTSARPLRRPIP